MTRRFGVDGILLVMISAIIGAIFKVNGPLAGLLVVGLAIFLLVAVPWGLHKVGRNPQDTHPLKYLDKKDLAVEIGIWSALILLNSFLFSLTYSVHRTGDTIVAHANWQIIPLGIALVFLDEIILMAWAPTRHVKISSQKTFKE